MSSAKTKIFKCLETNRKKTQKSEMIIIDSMSKT